MAPILFVIQEVRSFRSKKFYLQARLSLLEVLSSLGLCDWPPRPVLLGLLSCFCLSATPYPFLLVLPLLTVLYTFVFPRILGLRRRSIPPHPAIFGKAGQRSSVPENWVTRKNKIWSQRLARQAIWNPSNRSFGPFSWVSLDIGTGRFQDLCWNKPPGSRKEEEGALSKTKPRSSVIAKQADPYYKTALLDFILTFSVISALLSTQRGFTKCDVEYRVSSVHDNSSTKMNTGDMMPWGVAVSDTEPEVWVPFCCASGRSPRCCFLAFILLAQCVVLKRPRLGREL